MKISADYRMLALDALRGKWKTAVLTGIAASALGATIVSSSNSVVSNSNQAKDIHFNLFAQPNGGRLLAVLLVGIGLWAILQLIVGGAVQLGYAHFNFEMRTRNRHHLQTKRPPSKIALVNGLESYSVVLAA